MELEEKNNISYFYHKLEYVIKNEINEQHTERNNKKDEGRDQKSDSIFDSK